jgi:hypothetical protein
MATAPKTIESSPANDAAKKRLRSPAYPYLNLETAIKRAKTFYDREGRNSAPVTVAATHWGYEAKSSGGTQTAAALMGFGLMQDEGTSDKRKLKLTQNALRILLDTRAESSEREMLIKQAALAPKAHQQIWAKWGAGISDENLRHALVFEWEPPFNENAVDGFIKEYRDTIAFAKLAESDKVHAEDGSSDGDSDSGYVPQVGDYVQWESQGMHQFKEPVKVLSISTDRTHAFVEGTSTGIPVGQLIRAAAPLTAPQVHVSRAPLLPQTNMQEDVYSLPEGRIVVQWPTALSPESVQEIKDYLKLLERKIVRSTKKDEHTE